MLMIHLPRHRVGSLFRLNSLFQQTPLWTVVLIDLRGPRAKQARQLTVPQAKIQERFGIDPSPRKLVHFEDVTLNNFVQQLLPHCCKHFLVDFINADTLTHHENSFSSSGRQPSTNTHTLFKCNASIVFAGKLLYSSSLALGAICDGQSGCFQLFAGVRMPEC